MKSNQGTSKRKRNNTLPAMMVIMGIVMIFLAWGLYSSSKLSVKLEYYNTRAEELQTEIENEQARTEEIDALREYMTTDAYIEEVAREKLGYLKENEIMFIEKTAE